MKILGQAARFQSRSILRLFVLLCAAAISYPAAASNRAPAPPVPEGQTQSSIVPLGIHGILQLDGPWRFQMGDNPQWADPGFDDSSWPTVMLGKQLSEQGVDTYSGYAWYRLRLQPLQLQSGYNTASSSLNLLVTSHSIGQMAVYLNGRESGHSRGMTDTPAMYQSPPFTVNLSRN